MAKQNSLENSIYKIGLLLLPVGILGFVLYDKTILKCFSGVPCVLYYLLGIYCPGCGGTRAVEALLEGAFLKSLWYHPLVLYCVILFGGFMLTHTLERFSVKGVKGWNFHSWYLYGALAIVVLNFIVKNLLLLCFQITI